MKIKKLLLGFAIWMALFLLWGVGISYAIGGVCSNCHTMHNSQNGATEVELYSGGALDTTDNPAQDQLLKASCVACHAGDEADSINAHGAPIVVHITDPVTQGGGKTLAGGDFRWVATGLGATDSKGHNVAGINSDDVALGKTPPGWDTAATPGALTDGSIAGGAGTWTTQLSCAGMYGCHGSHAYTDADAAIAGAHHGNTGGTSAQVTAPTTVGNSYRFLGGIKGLEDTTWNWDETSSNHNEYYGVAAPTTYGDKSTISYSCAQCHGDFHATGEIGGTSSPWTRHPTDFVLPTTGKEYSAYNPDGSNLYSVQAPVARGAVPASSSSTVTVDGVADADGAIVMCLSCHRAHGSPEPDLLRWTYSGIQAGSGTTDTGCFVCHTTKNAD